MSTVKGPLRRPILTVAHEVDLAMFKALLIPICRTVDRPAP